MSNWSQSRTPRVVLATALFLVVSFNSPPTIPSVPENRPQPPSPEEIYLLEQVAEWVLGQPLTTDFRAFKDHDIVSAVRRARKASSCSTVCGGFVPPRSFAGIALWRSDCQGCRPASGGRASGGFDHGGRVGFQFVCHLAARRAGSDAGHALDGQFLSDRESFWSLS